MISFIACLSVLSAVWWLTGRHTADERMNCKLAWEWACGNLDGADRTVSHEEILELAVEHYMKKYPEVFPNKRACRAGIRRWVEKHSSPSDFRDTPGPGQPSFVTDDECQQCIDELKAGYYDDHGHFWLYQSLTEAANLGRCPKVAECLERYSHADQSSLWRRLRQYDPQLVHFKPRRSHQYDPRLLKERHDAARTLNGWDFLKRWRVFFIDEKLVLFIPKIGTYIGYMGDDGEIFIEVDDPKWYNKISHTSELVKVQFYSMVNWYAGVCGFELCQSTTGMTKKYKVRHQPTLLNTCAHPPLLLHAARAWSRAASQLPWLWSSSTRNTL